MNNQDDDHSAELHGLQERIEVATRRAEAAKRQGDEDERRAVHFEGIIRADWQAENERRAGFGIPPLPMPELLRGR